MGVDISNIVEFKSIDLNSLALKKIGVDAFNMIYQFLSIIRQVDGSPLMDSKGRVTSHLSGIFYRTINMLKCGIKPCFVFDGKAPEFKKRTQELRREIKEKAAEEYEKALEQGDLKKAFSKATQTSRLTYEMIESSKKLLDLMGIPIIQAPSEGEAQASFMAKKNEFYAVGSQDFDSLLFGAPRLVRNLAITGRRKLPGKQVFVKVEPEIIELENVLKDLNLNHEQLIILGILVGTDYNPGIKGIGPKKALKLILEKKTFDLIFKEVNWDFEIPPEQIYNLFKNPEVSKDYKNPEWKSIDIEKVKKMLCDEYDFSEERINSAYKKFLEEKKSGSQMSLTGF